MLHLITITIGHMYTNLHTQPLISVGKHDTSGDQKCPYLLDLIQLDWQHNFIRCSKGMQMHLKWRTDIDTVHTYLPPFNPRISRIWNKYFTCIVTCSKILSCYLMEGITMCWEYTNTSSTTVLLYEATCFDLLNGHHHT